MFLRNMLGSLANSILGVERFRSTAACPGVEYGIEVELASGGDGDQSELNIFGLSGGHVGIIKATEMHLVLEKVSLGEKDEVINTVLADILDVCDIPPP